MGLSHLLLSTSGSKRNIPDSAYPLPSLKLTYCASFENLRDGGWLYGPCRRSRLTTTEWVLAPRCPLCPKSFTVTTISSSSAHAFFWQGVSCGVDMKSADMMPWTLWYDPIMCRGLSSWPSPKGKKRSDMFCPKMEKFPMVALTVRVIFPVGSKLLLSHEAGGKPSEWE
jgi:hypothetical protein